MVSHGAPACLARYARGAMQALWFALWLLHLHALCGVGLPLADNQQLPITDNLLGRNEETILLQCCRCPCFFGHKGNAVHAQVLAYTRLRRHLTGDGNLSDRYLHGC